MNEQNWELMGMPRKFDINRHMIWIIEKSFDDIETPEGYKIVKKDYIKKGLNKYPRTIFVNTIPVVADLYFNTKTKEECYYFAGKPIKNKILIKK